jgi:hypothetical protein
MQILTVERVCLSMQRALLGEIWDELDAVSVNFSQQENWILITFITYGSLSDEQRDSITSIAANIAADFNETSVETIVDSELLSSEDQILVFAKKNIGQR